MTNITNLNNTSIAGIRTHGCKSVWNWNPFYIMNCHVGLLLGKYYQMNYLRSFIGSFKIFGYFDEILITWFKLAVFKLFPQKSTEWVIFINDNKDWWYINFCPLAYSLRSIIKTKKCFRKTFWSFISIFDW